MALKLLDMVAMTGTVTGEADVQLSAAISGFRTLAAAGVVDGDFVPYRIESDDGTLWEVGLGEYYELTGVGYISRYAQVTYISFPAATACNVYLTAPAFMLPAVRPPVSGSSVIRSAPRADLEGGVAVGAGAIAAGAYSTAVGQSAATNTTSSVALGYSTKADADGAIALGSYSAVERCAAIGRGSSPSVTDHSGLLLWTGDSTGASAAADAHSQFFSLPDVPCIASLQVLIAGATSPAFADQYAAIATLAIKRPSVNGTLQVVGTPVVTAIVADGAGTAIPAFAINGTGTASRLYVTLGRTDMDFNVVITASVIQPA